MASISVTYTFANSTTSDATEVNTNFQDLIDGTTDSSKDFSISALTLAGTLTANGNVNIGNATSDDLTITARIASDLDPKTAATNTLGDSTQTWKALYLDFGATDGGAVYFNASSTSFLKSNADGTELALGGFVSLGMSSTIIKKTAGTKTTSYTVTDTDGLSTILVTTDANPTVITLPTVANNLGRIITVKKVAEGAATQILSLDGAGSETIDGKTGNTAHCPIIGDFVTVIGTSTGWEIIARKEVSKWVSFTATTGNITVGNGNIATYLRRNGSSMEVMYNLRLQSTSSFAASTAFTFTVPYSLNVENTITGSVGSPVVGYGETSDATSPFIKHSFMILYNSTTQLVSRLADGTNNGITDTSPITWANGDHLSFNFSIPVTEWID